MPRTRQPAAPAPEAPPRMHVRAGRRAAAGGKWISANIFILSIIAFNADASFNHMTHLASTKGGQYGWDIQLSATIFDLFVVAMRYESQRDRKRGTISQKWRMTAPVFFQQVALFFSVIANYATAKKGFWGVTFGIAPPIMVMLAIWMLERRYRLDAEARTAAGTAEAAPAAPAGTGPGTGPDPAGTGTGTAPRTAPAPSGTGTGQPAGAAAGEPGADVVPLRDYFVKDGKYIPADVTVPGDDDRAGQLAAVRYATARYLAKNMDTTVCPLWALAAACRKNKTWVLAARAELARQDRDAREAAALAAAADTAPKELSA